MGSKKSSKNDQPSRASRGLNKIPSVGKKTWRILRAVHDLPSADAMVARQMKIFDQKGSKQLIKKWTIEKALTQKALDIYRKNEDKVLWSQVVHAVKSGTMFEIGNKVYKKSRNEYPMFEVKIKTSEIEKYNQLLKDN